jgi:hypothetical protein
MKEELRAPLGDLMDDEAFCSFFGPEICKKVITVGDIITRRIVNEGVLPWISIIDGKTKREALNNEFMHPREPVYVKNPPGTITYELWSVIERACRDANDTLIFVDGEEDLATLPAILLAPAGTLVLYGMPNQGVVVVRVDEAKEKVKELLKKMEVKHGDKDR